LELLPVLLPALDALPELDWAVGGAVAMALHGYSRHTDDLDVFFRGADVNRVLHTLRRLGVRFATIADPFHYAIFPDLTDPDRRIDLLFAWDDVEADAIAFPDDVALELGGRAVSVRYFPLTLLVAAKARSDRPRDHDDVARMAERGLFDPAEVALALARLGEGDEVLDRLAALCRPRPPGRPRRRG
jgi:hypothetical protein